MNKDANKMLRYFYQSAPISALVADDLAAEGNYPQAIRLLWEAYNFSKNNEYLEKIAVLYGLLDGAEEEGINLLAELFSNSREKNFDRNMLIVNTLHLKLKSHFVKEDTDAYNDSLLDEVNAWAESMGFEIVRPNRDPFYVYDKKIAYLNDFKERINRALDENDAREYSAIVDEMLKIKDFEYYEELLTFAIFNSLSSDINQGIIPLIERLVLINPKNEFGVISALAICKEMQRNPFSFNIDGLATDIVKVFIQKSHYNQLGILLSQTPYSICKNTVILALSTLSSVETYTLKNIYAVAAQYINVGSLEKAKEYVEIGKTIYPRSPLFLYLNWCINNRLVDYDVLMDQEKISKLLLDQLIYIVEKYENDLAKIENNKDNATKTEGQLSSVTHILEKWHVLDKISILLFLGVKKHINTLFDKLIKHGDNVSYFNFLVKELASAYYRFPIKISIFTAIQFINKRFRRRAFTLFDKSIFVGSITTQSFDVTSPSYKIVKKMYVDSATKLFFIDVPIDRGLLKDIVLKFNIIASLISYDYNVVLASIIVVYYKKIKTDSDIELIYKALNVNKQSTYALLLEYSKIKE